MKYAVIVNQKFLVTVEANTHGGAEHKILDNVYYGIETCQAFTIDEMTTDVFKALVENCETISYDEMVKRSKDYKATLDEIKEDNEMVEKYTKQLNELYKEIEIAKDNMRVSLHNIEIAELELKEIW